MSMDWQRILLMRILILAAAAAADLVIGDPRNLPHPVTGVGAVIRFCENGLFRLLRIKPAREEQPVKKLAAGAVFVCAVLVLSVTPLLLLLYLTRRAHGAVWFLVRVVPAWQILAMRSLYDAAEDVRRPLEKKQTEEARHAVSMIVGRDTDRLDEEGIIKAAVETVAENTSDGVVAPLFYMFLFGVAGGWIYKVVNTMDSMTGYRNDRYLYFGRAAARLDDAANFIPARIAGAAMAAGAFLAGAFARGSRSGTQGGQMPEYDGRNALRIFLRDRKLPDSPNAGCTEAACAGALHIALGGDAYYFGELHRKPVLGDAGRPVEVRDIRRAEVLMGMTSAIVFGAGILALALAAFLL